MTFKKLREYETRKGVFVSEYEHEKTGAIHIHTKVDGGENVFNIAFKTPVDNNKGIPHILEHMVLEGSKKYPSHNMFYKLAEKNFETEMNAGTYNNFTTYYFGTNVEEGYFNLADVYLDAVLNPLITEATFLQEGFRYEKNEAGDLVFSGVVYNEMMAWVGQKGSELEQVLEKELYGNHPLSSNAGGDPIEIANVTYQEILDFHKKCYNPSNSTTFTLGNISVSKIQDKLEEFFNKFERNERLDLPKVLEREKKYKVIKTEHAGEETTAGMLSISLGKDNYNEKSEDFRLLSNLVSLSNEKMCDYFTAEDKGVGLSAIYVELVDGEVFLRANFDLKEENNVDDVWKIWSFGWQKIVEEGIDHKIIDSVFNKRIFAFDNELEKNYSSSINGNTFYYYMQKDQFMKERSTKEYLLQVREDMKDGLLVNTIINDKFLRKNNATIVYSKENTNLISNYNEKIALEESKRNSLFSENEKEDLAQKIKYLRDQEVPTVDNLPEVILDNNFSPEKVMLKSTTKISHKEVNGVNIRMNNFNDNDVRARIHLSFPVVAETEEELIFETIQEQVFVHAALKKMTREEANVWKKEGLSSIMFNIYALDKEHKVVTQNLVVNGYKDKLDVLVNKAIQVRTMLDLEDKEGFKKTLKKVYLETQEENSYNLDRFTNIFSALGHKNHALVYIESVKYIKTMRSMLEGLENGKDELFQKFAAYYESEKRKNVKANMVILDDDDGTMLNILEKSGIVGNGPDLRLEDVSKLSNEDFDDSKKIALVADTSSAFAAYSVGNMPTLENAEDCLKMGVAANYMSEYALETIRVKMGAYGAWARVVNGTMIFFAYRTPKPFESVEYYKTMVNDILSEEINQTMLDAAKRKAFGDFIAYYSKRALARKEDAYWMRGKTMEEVCTKYINIILSYNEKDMKDILEKYFNKNNMENICVTTNEEVLNKNEELLEGFKKIKFPL